MESIKYSAIYTDNIIINVPHEKRENMFCSFDKIIGSEFINYIIWWDQKRILYCKYRNELFYEFYYGWFWILLLKYFKAVLLWALILLGNK